LANKLGRGFSGVRRQRRRRVCCIEMSLTITLHAWWLQLGPSANPQTRGSNPDPDPSPFPIQLPFLSRYLPRGTWAEDKWAAVLDLLDCLFTRGAHSGIRDSSSAPSELWVLGFWVSSTPTPIQQYLGLSSKA